MTDRQAISVLECMAIDMTGALGEMSEDDSAADAIRRRLDAINAAQTSLQTKIEVEKNEPLTSDELREMDGEPVYCLRVERPEESAWGIVCNRDIAPHVRAHLQKGRITSLFYFAYLGTDWQAYRRKPKEGC